MPNKTINADIICPFYRSENDVAIRCEGVIPGTVITNRFKNRAQLERYQNCFCTTFGYGECGVSKAVDKKYNGVI